MAIPPTDPGYRRYWGRVNRPYSGCGCVWMLLAFVLISAVLSALLPNTTICFLPFVF